MLVQTYFDSDHDPSFKALFNGFTKSDLLDCLRACSTEEQYKMFRDETFDFHMPLFLNLGKTETFEHVDSLCQRTFVYPIQWHWWMPNSKEFCDKLRLDPGILKAVLEKRCRILLYNTFEGWSMTFWRIVVDNIISKYPMLALADFVVTCNNITDTTCGLTNMPLVNTQRYQTPGNFGDFGVYRNVTAERIANRSIRKYRFVCLNRRPHIGRWGIFTLLFSDKDVGILTYNLDFSIPSLSHDSNFQEELSKSFKEDMQNTESSIYNDYVDFQLKLPLIHSDFEKNDLLSQLPLFLKDDVDPRTNPIHDQNLFKFTDSYLHIVTETYIEDDSARIHLSEKIFKPIWYMQPFVVVGQRNILAGLKTLGYKTFDKWIDESYDDEIDIETRITKIAAAAKAFYARPISVINEDLLDMLPVLLHNHEVITKYSHCDDRYDYVSQLLEIK